MKEWSWVFCYDVLLKAEKPEKGVSFGPIYVQLCTLTSAEFEAVPSGIFKMSSQFDLCNR